MDGMGDATHLDRTTRPLLQLDDAGRIASIDQDLWIGYGLAQEAHQRLEQLLRSQRRSRPDNLLLIGASNNGKTAIAKRFLARHHVTENPLAEIATIPVALILAPNGPKIPALLRAILHAIGRDPLPRTQVADLREAAYQGVRDVAMRLLLIDDLHNIRGSGVDNILVELRNLGSATGVSLGCFATKEIAYILRRDEQMANRFGLMTLPRWRFEDVEYAKLLATFEQCLPLRRRSNLTEPALAERILVQAEGLIGAIAGLLRQAAVEAIRTGHERIDAAMLARVHTPSPSRIEALANREDL
jgi:Bacterial TniB protein